MCNLAIFLIQFHYTSVKRMVRSTVIEESEQLHSCKYIIVHCEVVSIPTKFRLIPTQIAETDETHFYDVIAEPL